MKIADLNKKNACASINNMLQLVYHEYVYGIVEYCICISKTNGCLTHTENL